MRDYGPDAVIFDLDGVITFTARLHAAAWKQLFDDYLHVQAERSGKPFRPFDAEADYHAYVDGKPRYDGVQSFLESRGIKLSRGTPSDLPSAETICGLGNRKNCLFNAKVREMGVDVDEGAVRFVRELREFGVHVGLASSSKNAVPILEQVGILGLFEAVVDGLVSEHRHLRGKPQPDIFIECLRELTGHVETERAAIVEDAISGVQAGRLGGFGLVLGVDRSGSGALQSNGADWIIRNFGEISARAVFDYFADRGQKAAGER